MQIYVLFSGSSGICRSILFYILDLLVHALFQSESDLNPEVLKELTVINLLHEQVVP